ncbi:Guanine nucleotide-binding protein-like 1 [Termitomyces sp. J132]|nr:Guanine nucleotide-binding protein-like 1 [Termitomyces sp. J132]
MPRRKPTSTRQKKADIQLKRAIKRGDVPPSESKKEIHKPKLRRGPTGTFIGSVPDPAHAATVHAAARLQSSFITLSSKFLEDTKVLASKLPLTRPIPDAVVIHTEDFQDPTSQKFTCPRRPKWRFDMTKKEVELNEEGMFKNWLDQMDRCVLDWQNEFESDSRAEESDCQDGPLSMTEIFNEEFGRMPRSPTYFERNLDVWRQLWRVAELSQILLVLLDSRCPPLHFPPSLASYTSDRKIILVLTKVDIIGPERTSAWVEYLHKKYPHLPVVQVESYAAKQEGAGHQGKPQYEPHLPSSFRERLVAAIQQVHTEMMIPPEKVRLNPQRLSKWKPPVKADVDWDNVMKASDATYDRAKESEEERFKIKQKKGLEFLTIGLIGQPNVGKSSLLNALFGVNKVGVSKNPGKFYHFLFFVQTKHLQTLIWTPDVRLVDCPGLVMPNGVPMEMQALCGILPISCVSAVSSSIFLAAQRLPIEHIYGLEHPELLSTPVLDKRTWRDGVRSDSGGEKPLVWTAMDVLVAYANEKKWFTAKAGRPDVHRAGNALLRALAEGKIGWAFWPPDTDLKTIVANMDDPGSGIWIPRALVIDSDGDEIDEDEVIIVTSASSDDEAAEEDDETEHGGGSQILGVSRFRALSVDDVEEDEEDEGQSTNCS